MMYQDLPLEVILSILEYCGIIKFRDGKWINQISPVDERYSTLLTIPRPLITEEYKKVDTYGRSVLRRVVQVVKFKNKRFALRHQFCITPDPYFWFSISSDCSILEMYGISTSFIKKVSIWEEALYPILYLLGWKSDTIYDIIKMKYIEDFTPDQSIIPLMEEATKYGKVI